MGLQVRKRTKGKNSWFNFSYSKKKGIGASVSIKLDKNITYNTRGRTTINFGNGVRYVHTRKKKKETKVKEYVPKSRSRARYREEYVPVLTFEERLDKVKEYVISLAQLSHFTKTWDLEYLVDVHNAIVSLKEEPTSLDSTDLIVITTTRLIEFAEKTKDEDFIHTANVLASILTEFAPKRPTPPWTPPYVVWWKRKTTIWGTIFAYLLFVG